VRRYVNGIFLLTSIDFLLHDTINCAFVHCNRILRLQCWAINIARVIKRALQGVVFPAEQVVTVVCVTSAVRQVSGPCAVMIGLYSPVTKTPHKRLRPIARPIIFVVELGRVPNDFVEQLTHAHRM
jgi:hypothetical protein